MIYLIEYNRSLGKIITLKRFRNRRKAEKIRFLMDSMNEAGHEIVTLEASNINILKHTHGRYFKTLSELSDDLTHVTAHMEFKRRTQERLANA